MKHCGTVYDEFMSHITIDEGLYTKINEEGLKPEEVKFEPLTIEQGAGNTIHHFESEDMNKAENLEKGFKNKVLGAGLAIAGALAPSYAHAPDKGMARPEYSSNKMLNTIARVESQGGKYTRHMAVQGAMHSGARAYGKYALMPNTIRETIKMHPELRQQHKKAIMLHGPDLHHYMQDNPGLEDTIAKKHLKRLEHHFGTDHEKIGYAWLNGIQGAYKASKSKNPHKISDHWHVQKIRQAFGEEK